MPATPHHITCGSCGASLDVPHDVRATRCPYCASPQVLEKPAAADRPRPRLVIPFSVPADRARAAVAAWQRRHGFWAPRAFARAPVEDIEGVYMPAWLYSARANARFRASIGEDYQVTRVTGKGRRKQTKTEWRHVEGDWAAWVGDALVTASRGVPNTELERIEPYELGGLRAYRPELVSGWLAEDPSLAHHESLELGRREAEADVARRLARFLPGDKHRELEQQTTLENEDTSLVLLPTWVLAVRLGTGRPPLRVLVNGQTGRVGGRTPISWPKVLLTVSLIAAVIAGMVIAAGMRGGGP